ncbi:VOC family protein [Halapricum hydrolyticum]|uniref:VOC family protein n=1 Tax=Halapricum hydrolyticum TaxID=2979991 RepID=A0AAE3LDY7_9EURY|nr:VOC family protein [Halapricum hydrolyticum]MCU4716708.1 VOC family protein [Halapricum hydrolyticum]MCU4725687.1 VOC family protein [Halapricum hydrolyticum]
MSGIVFFGTADRGRVVEFYRERLGFEQWLEQPECTILQYENLLVGFCERDGAETGGVVTVVEETRDEVDKRYDDLADVADNPPSENEPYRIYNFFGTDPDGRSFEVQTFLHETEPIREGNPGPDRNP